MGRSQPAPWRRLLLSQDVHKRLEVAGGAWRCAGLGFQTETEWPKAERENTGTWVENPKSDFWTVCWVKFGKGHWYPNMQWLIKESGLNSESSEEPL